MGDETASRALKGVEQVEQGSDRPMPPVVERWCDLLAEEGYRPRPELKEGSAPHWFIPFKHEGTRFGVYLDEKDPTYMQLELAYTVDPTIAPLTTLLEVANEINSLTKGVKVTVSPAGDSAWFMLEWFSESVPSPAVLGRLLSQARHAAEEFFEKREAKAAPEAQA